MTAPHAGTVVAEGEVGAVFERFHRGVGAFAESRQHRPKVMPGEVRLGMDFTDLEESRV